MYENTVPANVTAPFETRIRGVFMFASQPEEVNLGRIDELIFRRRTIQYIQLLLWIL